MAKKTLRKNAAAKTAAKKKSRKAGGRRAASGAKPAGKAQPRGLTARAAPDPFLGHASAVTIVCRCANTEPANLGRTLQELGVAGGPFQVCVFNAVTAAGCSIALDAIPNSSDTMLITAVNVIQVAPRTR